MPSTSPPRPPKRKASEFSLRALTNLSFVKRGAVSVLYAQRTSDEPSHKLCSRRWQFGQPITATVHLMQKVVTFLRVGSQAPRLPATCTHNSSTILEARNSQSTTWFHNLGIPTKDEELVQRTHRIKKSPRHTQGCQRGLHLCLGNARSISKAVELQKILRHTKSKIPSA